MGLFGTLLKVVGKVAKSGLSVATHGASDKVLSIAKSLGHKPTAKTSQYPTNAQQAMVARLSPEGFRPSVKLTQSRLEEAAADGGMLGSYGKRRGAGRRRRARGRGATTAFYATRKPSRRSKGSTTRSRAPKARSGRRAPSGGLDLKKMAQEWRSAGKPGSWRDWIKSHQLRKA